MVGWVAGWRIVGVRSNGGKMGGTYIHDARGRAIRTMWKGNDRDTAFVWGSLFLFS